MGQKESLKNLTWNLQLLCKVMTGGFFTSAYSAMRSAPDSLLINDYQPHDQHLSTTLSSPVIRLISAC